MTGGRIQQTSRQSRPGLKLIVLLVLMAPALIGLINRWAPELGDNAVQIVDPIAGESQVADPPPDTQLRSSDWDRAELRANTGATPVTLPGGTYRVGTDLTPGRYEIRVTESTYPFVSISYTPAGSEYPLVNEDIGPGGESDPSTPAGLTVTLADGGTLEIDPYLDELGTVSLTPQSTSHRAKLTPGEWVVGLDFAPGVYRFQASGPGTVRVEVLEADDPTGLGPVWEILDPAGAEGTESIVAEVSDGQIVTVHHAGSLTLIPLDETT